MERQVNAMKPIIRFIFITLMLTLLAFTCANAAVSPEEFRQLTVSQMIALHQNQSADESPDTLKASSSLPASLQMIDDSAFEGTALVFVDLPENMVSIGDQAFANIPTLLGVRIPDSVKHIGKDAFTGSRQVTMTANGNSYARTWAEANGVPFAGAVIYTASDGSPQIPGLYPGRTVHEKLTTTETTEAPKYSEQNGRAEGEIKAAKHEECFAYSIQGRSPPMAG